jgi:hypothetical protein
MMEEPCRAPALMKVPCALAGLVRAKVAAPKRHVSQRIEDPPP